jgi:hypothetical protein
MSIFDAMTLNPETTEFAIIGKLYLVLWIVISNIMLFNLLIALFSDTYNKLINIGEGLFLIEMIEISP